MSKKTNPDCCAQKHHSDHATQIGRLNRVAGQIEGVKKMIDKRAYCPDILAQLRAVRAAVTAIEANILEAHLDSCVAEAFASGNSKNAAQKITELKELYKRFGG